MEKTTKTKRPRIQSKHPLDRQFDSVQEAAKAKTEHVLSTVFKNADWDSLKNR
jgi:hypothetical protein